MHPLRKIPLHMLLLAGLAVPAAAAEPKLEKSAEVEVAAANENLQAYAGVNVLSLTPGFRDTELRMEIPEGVGIVVGLVDPAGPAAGKLLEKDVLTRLDDQVLVNAEQFRTLIRNRKPGQVAKLVRLRGDDVDTVEITLAGRPAQRPRPSAPSPDGMPDSLGSMGSSRIVINGQEIDPSQMIGGGTITFGAGGPGGQVVIVGPGSSGIPEEIRRQLDEMRARGLPVPELGQVDETISPPAAGATSARRVTTFSRSFSFGTAGGSSSTLTDEQGTVSIRKDGDKKVATVKDAEGKTLFDGEITQPEQVAALPEVVRERLAQADRPALSLPGLPSAGAKPDAAGATEKKAAGEGSAPAKPRRKIDPREGA